MRAARVSRAGRAALAAALLLASPASAGDPPAPALARAADELASRLSEVARSPEPVALQVLAPGAEGLAGPLSAALSEALSRRGFAVALFAAATGPGAEEAARILGADRLLRVTAGLVPGRRELVLASEAVPTRASFFLQRAPEFRSGGARLWTVSVPADEATLLLARAGGRTGPTGPALWVRPLFRLEERVLAVAVGDAVGDGTTQLVLASPRSVSVVTLGGAVRARYVLDPDVPGPRRPAATVAVGAFGPGRIALGRAGSPSLLLDAAGGALLPVGTLPSVPLPGGERGALFGAFVPGKAVLADALSRTPDPVPPARSPREYAAFASAPRPGRFAHAWVTGDGVLELLGPGLDPVGAPVEGVGAGFALADLDGDGEPELVASTTDSGATDRIRVLRWPAGAGPAAPPVLVLESPPVPGSLLAGAAADVTGDGLDDAVVVSVLPGGGSELWLVTADPRFAEVR
ncbi:MAG TPA: VCBS repeat-containing protein [Anaeromyxobacteraceae bacterium]|nr:VCBS repeat-containing protein [Anaeromyxobacteraceae bacterium]